jgi:nucleotide-binding universal stress UspA family protein
MAGPQPAPEALANGLQQEQGMSTTIPRHILVPHDFSDTAQNALSFALDLASKLGAHVTVMHAYEIPTFAYPEGVALTAEVVSNIRRAAQTALDGVAARSRRPGLEVQALLRQGPAWSEIDASAKDMHADLIVMGTHGRHGLARALLGSVAERVVRTAPCPVLTVHGSTST